MEKEVDDNKKMVLLSKCDSTRLFLEEKNVKPIESTYHVLVPMEIFKDYYKWEKAQILKTRRMFEKVKISKLLNIWLKESKCVVSMPEKTITNDGWITLTGKESEDFKTWKRELLDRFPAGMS